MASDDTITINCVESHATGVFRELMTMKERRQWTDFLINIDKTSLPCHRNIICANSGMIRELLDDEEMPAAAKDAINLDHINLATMEQVLDFMYSGKISFRGDELKEYLEVAVNLKMDNLTARCLDHVPSYITVENALGWLRLGFRRKLTELIDHAARVIVLHFAEITCQRDFLTLDYPQVERCLTAALNDETSGQVGRDNVLRSVIAWVSYGDGNRVTHLEDLVNLVNPETCSSDALMNLIQAHPAIISQNPAVLVSLVAAAQHISKQDTGRQPGREDGEVVQIEGAMSQDKANVTQDGEAVGNANQLDKSENVKTKKKAQDKSQSSAIRRSKKLPVIIGGHVNYEASSKCWVLHEDSNRFVQFSKIPVDKLGQNHSVCETDVGFSVTGGEYSDICLQYSLFTKTWSNLKKMLEVRRNHGSFFRKGEIYVFGGMISGSKSKSVHCLDIARGYWLGVMELPIALKNPKVAHLNDHAYILDEFTRRLMRMDVHVEKKTCVELSPLPGEGHCIGVSMTKVNDKLCAAGSKPPICAMYEPDTDTWSEMQRPNQWHSYGSLIFYQDKLLLLGGKWNPDSAKMQGSDDVEEYAFAEEKWLTSGIKMPQKSLSYHYSFVLDIPQQE